MRQSKVTLLIRIRTADGRQPYCKPVWLNRNELKPLWAFVNGKPEHRPEGVYHLRYTYKGQRRWETLGKSAETSFSTRNEREWQLNNMESLTSIKPDLHGKPKTEAPDAPGRLTLEEAVSKYLAFVKAQRSERTWQAYTHTLGQFRQSCSKKYLDEITKQDLADFVVFMKNRNLSDRTVANRVEEVVTLLRDPDETRGKSKGIKDVTLRVKYAEKKVRSYKPHETKTLFAAADQEEEETFKFFLGTGARDQEAQQARWVDIDFEGRVFHIIDDGDTRTKDREERLVPMADDLVEMLRARRKRFPKDRLIFPNNKGGPQGHFLRMLKELALRAGLNCGACVSKQGQSCKDTACCERWILHRFRKTFATSRHRDGASLLDLKKWLGHSDLKTTELYLAESDLESPEVRSCTNNSYAAYV
jgi:integrase/recombinase XerD